MGAIADGVVLFAGPVAGALHVTVLHADGVRSSYSFLAQVLVAIGQRVVRGQPVGVAGARLHLGARTGPRTYIDPATLWGGPPHVYLVPPDGAGSAAGPPSDGTDQQDLASAARLPAPVVPWRGSADASPRCAPRAWRLCAARGARNRRGSPLRVAEYRACVDFARTTNAKELTLLVRDDNAGGRRFYEREGFELTGS